MQLLEEVGLPAGVVNVIPTSTSSKVSGPIIADPRLRKLSFTGSTEVGRALMKQAAQGILRTSMELGGNAPFVVFEDADLDKAVDGAMIAKFRNIGQACTAANRFIVHESVADEFAKRVAERVKAMKVGRGTEDGVNIGPLIDEQGRRLDRRARAGRRRTRCDRAHRRHPHRRRRHVLRAHRARGRRRRAAACSPRRSSARCSASPRSPTKTRRCGSRTRTEYGLVSYVFTQDLARGHRMIDRLDTGMMGLNTGLVSNAAAPFGGVKQSGIGREGGLEGIHEYLDTKYTLIPVN